MIKLSELEKVLAISAMKVFILWLNVLYYFILGGLKATRKWSGVLSRRLSVKPSIQRPEVFGNRLEVLLEVLLEVK